MNTPALVLILLIIIVLVAGGLFMLISQENTRKKRAMAVIRGGVPEKKGKEEREKNRANKRRAEITQKLQDENEGEDSGKKKTTVAMLIGQAGLSTSVKKFWILSIILTVIAVFISSSMGASPLVIILIGVTALLGIPRLVLKKMASRRQAKFLEEFPDALEATVRLLKAGMPVSEAIKMISKEYTGPVGEEMSIVYDKQKIGVPLHEAAFEATRRIPLPEMQMFATGLAIQAQTGASLSEVLMNLSGVIRARFRLKRKVKALSSDSNRISQYYRCIA